ncbi:purine-binding chemotaxis protein CheW [Desulfoprunum benzoelyticum]|uniref:Purine-binding chemotaxis protein CheW n=1 Tax=Desulfoprunum benzoelyticum TaxID=1506996 RepID=A0A840V483_9BACT|nr:chemotaxis protein CheW [Desulfoprunum benzoelyticum]MBB5347911.1 purine-binding chemotaxis protein CheW [Desulfoprunum benzoelyticum]MBM9530332.1 purine-binding chemotaxis protein CheW [Desulfoprunum benzoelyticum]
MGTGRFDWDEIHRKVQAVGVAIDSGYAPGPEESRRILQRRAAQLAQKVEKEGDAEVIEVVEFLLAHEHYGIGSHYIREVYPLRDYTPLPGVPSFVLGLINVRGRILSVVDLKKFFDLPAKGISDLNKVIIIGNETMEFGILADAILGVRTIAVSAIGPPLPTLTGIREEFVQGVTGERLVILHAARILTDGKIIVHHDI